MDFLKKRSWYLKSLPLGYLQNALFCGVLGKMNDVRSLLLLLSGNYYSHQNIFYLFIYLFIYLFRAEKETERGCGEGQREREIE